VYAKVVSQLSNSGTGTQDFTHGESWTPKVAIFQWNRANTSTDTFQEHCSYGKGFTDGTNERCVAIASEDNQARSDTARIQRNDAVICALSPTGTVTSVDAVASFSSWLSNGIRINWTDAPSAQFYVSVLLLGGNDITNTEVGTIMTTSTTGDKSITSLSWQPDYGMFLCGGSITENTGVVSAFISEGHATSSSAQHVTSTYALDNPATMSTKQYFSNGKVAIYHTDTAVDGYATFSSFNSNGFTINVGDAFGSSVPIYYLLIKGGQFKVGHFTIPTGSPQQQTVTTNTDVKAVMVVGQNSNVADTISNRANIYSGMATATDNQYVDSWQDENATADSVVVSRHDTNALCLSLTANATASSSTIEYEGAFYSKSATNFVIDWTNLQSAVDCRYVTFGGANLIDVTKSVTAKFDIIQDVPKSVTAKFDIYQDISKSVTAKYDIYQEIAKQTTIKFDVYQEVTKTFTTLFDIYVQLFDVIKTFTTKFDIYEDLETSRTIKFDIYEDVSKQATIKFDIIQEVVKKFKAVFDIIPTKSNYIPLTGSSEGYYYIGYASYLVNVIKTITAKFDILEEVTKDATIKFDVYEEVSKSITAKFDILQEIAKSVTVKFDIMQEVIKQITVLHDIYEDVSKSVITKFDIFQDVTKSATIKFDIIQEIQKQFTVLFDIFEMGFVDVEKTFAVLFNISQEVTKSTTTKFDIYEEIQKSIITKFDILQEVIKTSTVKFDIYEDIAKSVMTKFDILQEITKTATIKFDIIQEVTKQFTAVFDILEMGYVMVTKTFTTLFDVRQEVEKSVTTKFDIYEEVSKSIAIKFDIIQEIIKTNTMLFDILQQVEVSKTVKFDIYQEIEKDFTTIFDIIQDVEKQFTVIFNIESEIPTVEVEKIFTTKFDIYEDVEKSVTTKFDIIQEIVKRFRIKFNIKGKHHIDSDHAVMDNKQKDMFNKSDYSWNIADHRSKIKWSKKKGWFIDKA
jgi:hypothetical protein